MKHVIINVTSIPVIKPVMRFETLDKVFNEIETAMQENETISITPRHANIKKGASFTGRINFFRMPGDGTTRFDLTVDQNKSS